MKFIFGSHNLGIRNTQVFIVSHNLGIHDTLPDGMDEEVCHHDPVAQTADYPDQDAALVDHQPHPHLHLIACGNH